MKSIIICVDDDKWVLDVLANLLNDFLGKNYGIEKALSGAEALEIIDDCLAEGEEVSLVISDYIMPVMKGDELLEQVKLRTPKTRRIMLTGFAAIEGITNAINKAGIYRFMSKPWDNKDMMLTVLQAIHSYEQDKQNEKLANSYRELYQKSQSMAVNVQEILKGALDALSKAADLREHGVAGHSRRVADNALRLAKTVGMSEENSRNLETAALLHNVGRLGLTTDEINAIRGTNYYLHNEITMQQSEYAKIILEKMDERILDAVVYYTERVDGNGPYGKNLASIPIEARIISICSYYENVKTERPDADHAKIINLMQSCKAKVIDSVLFGAFSKMF